MLLSRSVLLNVTFVAVLGLSGTALMAQRGGWGGGWGDGPRWHDASGWRGGSSRSAEQGEGPIQVSRFRIEGDAALALAHGPILVVAMPAGGDDDAERAGTDKRFSATFEAAVEDRLVHSGYDAATIAPTGGQLAEVSVVRIEARPPEAPHKPVSGEVSMGVSNRGTSMGVGIMIDGSKPRGAIVSTRLEARIRDRSSGQVLWEGRAEMLTREGDKRWTDQAIADKLSAGLFDGFPVKIGEASLRR
jgi:hypothetical protein